MADQTIRSETAGGVARITIDREPARNSLSPACLAELKAAFLAADADPDVRVVMLTGAGVKAFCAGADLGSVAMEGGLLAGHEGRRAYAELLVTMVRLGRPIVARVNGHALAGGLGLLAACDLAIAADDAQFGTPEIDLGLFPYMAMALIARCVPRRHALELVLTGRRIDAREAAAMGLVNRAVPRAELDGATDALCATLASKSPAVLRLGRRAFHAMSDMGLEQALEYLSSMLSINALAEDAMEGVSAFLEKRKPEWKGR